ncbi:MAG: alpha-amylase family glycosyl hydrolase [Ignavibacteria bacterium]
MKLFFQKTIIALILLNFFLFTGKNLVAQNDVMMQAFYWEPPVDAANFNGSWWDTLASKANSLSEAGFTGMWVPPPSKGNWGITDMGYGLFDHYDLGNYNQKGTTETRFGSRSELEAMIDSMHNNDIEVYADIILNHIYGNEDQLEENPAVRYYVFHEAFTNGSQHVPYPTNEVVYKIRNAPAGYYYIKIKGYQLDCSDENERGYDCNIDWDGSGTQATTWWESEPNDGNGNWNSFDVSGGTVWGHIDDDCDDVDEYRIYLSSAHDIEIRLLARREATPFEWQWADQTNGYYPFEVWDGNSMEWTDSIEAWTQTGINYVTHTGTGEPNYSWNWTHFHPVDSLDWLGDGGCCDEIITNTKWFGNDLNTFSSTVQTRLKNWGYWMADEVGFDGFRLDFVRGFQESFAADWVNNLPLLSGNQRFIVAEYWGNAQVIHDWVDSMETNGADADAFDFPLKFTLTSMCNNNQSGFDMANLNHAGMVRNNTGQTMSGTQIVTFPENHDSGKEHDKWITQDWKMAYAYLLTHEGRPCVFYPHYYGVTQKDHEDTTITVTAPSSLQTDINKLIYVRNTYLGGSLTVLSEVGSPWHPGDTWHVYVARRAGNGTKSGAITVLNNHDSDYKSLWVNSSPSGWDNWANTTLVNAFDPNDSTVVQGDGRVEVGAPSRGYKVYVKKSEYAAFSKKNIESEMKKLTEIPLEFALEQNYPNPFNPSTKISFTIPEQAIVKVNIYNSLGELVTTLKNEFMSPGKHEVVWNAVNTSSGVYIYQVQYRNQTLSKRMLLLK